MESGKTRLPSWATSKDRDLSSLAGWVSEVCSDAEPSQGFVTADPPILLLE